VLNLNDFFYFVQVVDRGGFTAAGRTLRIPKSTLSHRIQRLKAELGVRLLNRTSRRFAIADAGEEFYRNADRGVPGRDGRVIGKIATSAPSPYRSALRAGLGWPATSK
jgi:DNA-binding transcriptional LysR family regulator